MKNGFNLIFMLLSCTNKKVTKEIAEGVPSEPLRVLRFEAKNGNEAIESETSSRQKSVARIVKKLFAIGFW